MNAGFLDRLARQGRGRFELVESEDRLDQVMAALARTIGRPALSGINITGSGIDLVETSITPALAPDAFAGVPCVISGRYRGLLDGEATISLSAVGTTGPFSMTTVPLRSQAAAVRTIWARAALRDLEDAYASGRDHEERLGRRIVEHSIRFGVLSRFTAFVAIDPERSDAEALDEVIQPVEWPSVTMARTGGAIRAASMAAMAPPPSAVTHTAAVAGPPSARSGRQPAQSRQAQRRRGAPAPRSLDEVLRTLARLLADPGATTDELLGVRKKLGTARDTTEDLDLRIALTRLCEAADTYLAARGTPTKPDPQPVTTAVEAVRTALETRTEPHKRSKKHFWE